MDAMLVRKIDSCYYLTSTRRIERLMEMLDEQDKNEDGEEDFVLRGVPSSAGSLCLYLSNVNNALLVDSDKPQVLGPGPETA